MIKSKELTQIIIAILIMSLVLSFVNLLAIPSTLDGKAYLEMLGYSAIIILVTIFAKKLSASNRGIEIEHKILGLKRWGIYARSYFKKAIPIGAILPLLLSILSQGYVKAFTFLQFDAKPLITKKIKKKSQDTHSEIEEIDLGMIAYWGLIATLALAIIADYLNYNLLAKYSFYYAIWNLIPFGQLDGMKILMASGEPIHQSSPRGSTKLTAILYFWSLILLVITGLIIFL